MPDQAWCVIGGVRSGGVVAREGQDTTSVELPDRLSTGAILKEVQLAAEGSRLNYQKLTGTGPSSGWVSTKFRNQDAVVRVWQVVGGGNKGGILVRDGEDTASVELPDRLATGALVKELKFIAGSGRLLYEALTGAGPSTGWVSTKLKDKQLVTLDLSDAASALSSTRNSASTAGSRTIATNGSGAGHSEVQSSSPLDIRMVNEEKRLSYETLPAWVPSAAAVAQLRRDLKPYLPPLKPPLERLALAKPLPPFKKLMPKKVREMFKQNLPGNIFGLTFPHTAEQMASSEFGAEWFTKAFHAAGTLSKDNCVTKVSHCQELSIDGYEKAGGAAMKARITIEYLTPDPVLHTDLFAKFTYDPAREVPGQITIGQDDGFEVQCGVHVQHLFPFRSPKFYFGDVCRETTVFLLIWEAIPYGKCAEDCKPYDILPCCGKFQDFSLRRPEEYYCAIFRAMGQLAGWDKKGRFDSLLEPFQTYSEKEYLQTTKRPTKKQANADVAKQVVGKTADKTIDFLMNWCGKMAPQCLRNPATLQKVKEDLVEMAPFLADMSNYFQASSSNYVAAVHANLQIDNAFFWRDEYGDLDIGVLDWGGFHRGPFCTRWLGCLSGASAEVLKGHLHGILQCFADEYARCGGPRLAVEDLVLRFNLVYITYLYDCFSYVERHVFKETSKEEFVAFTGVHDEEFQKRFYTRCGALPAMNSWTYFVLHGGLKTLFDEWAQGIGKPYLSVYE